MLVNEAWTFNNPGSDRKTLTFVMTDGQGQWPMNL